MTPQDDKSKLMFCWAPKSEFDSNERMIDCAGDLGVAVRMAYAHGINIFNTAVPALNTDCINGLAETKDEREIISPYY